MFTGKFSFFVSEGKSFSTWEDALKYLGKGHPLLRPFQKVKEKQLLKEQNYLFLQIRKNVKFFLLL